MTELTTATHSSIATEETWGIAPSQLRFRHPLTGGKALRRIVLFLVILGLAIAGLHLMITAGLHRIHTGLYGVSNRLFSGNINADIVITGSSRAVSHYDPRVIQQVTGHSAFNIGRNGSQTDMQLAVLKAYLNHNAAPHLVIHNLDAFTFQTTHEVYDLAQYMPYLDDPEIYGALKAINPGIWKSRYIPLYGYVVEDMRFAWILGMRGFAGWSPREDHFLGFDPRKSKWTDEFDSFKAQNAHGVDWEIDSKSFSLLESLVNVCQSRSIPLIFVYSPEFSEMQRLTRNRSTIFNRFRELAKQRGTPYWDFSEWRYASNTQYFTNSQHLNAEGAAIFSREFSNHLLDYINAGQKIAPLSGGIRHSS